ncbi:hypothetical protein NDU88_001977 [Pleurodeles waltl]|uniref:Uncharacterized protein n=1 Tax=Pleurodeles waltl TaxID=8319 RepID=A0AAV7LCX4_PLEWA|nr:hypothetical protein NDU88_001977 [Pleurodeles waltl]
MYRPHYHDRPIRHLFRGGSTADKNTAETDYERENAHLYALHEEGGQHGTRIKHPTCSRLPAHLPRIRTPAQTTTVGTAPTTQGRGEDERLRAHTYAIHPPPQTMYTPMQSYKSQ